VSSETASRDTPWHHIIKSMKTLKKSCARLFVVAGAILAVSMGVAAKDFVKPMAQPAQTYPAHDQHANEKTTIAVDPYDTAEKSKIFSVNFEQNNLLPIFFVVTNDGDQPISIANIEVTLTTGNHSHLTPISTEDIYRRLSNPHTKDTQLPFPFPNSKVKGTLNRKQMDEINSAQFAAKAVEPHGTQSGFLFFDFEDISAPLKGATLTVTGVDDAKGNELMYFEIPLEKYLNGRGK
jgi:hypothetical protein